MSENKNVWIQDAAIELCRKVEAVCPAFGCHVALTGGLLYKNGSRKDADLLFYRIRQQKEIDMTGLWKILEHTGLKKLGGWGWCYKAEYEGKPVDCFFPEASGSGTSNSEIKS